jgi:hypothetical protein
MMRTMKSISECEDSFRAVCRDSRPFDKLRVGSRLSGRAKFDSLLSAQGGPLLIQREQPTRRKP